MSSPYASVEDVKTRWVASVIPPEDNVIDTYLKDAATAIDIEFPALRAQTGSNDGVRERARLVSCRMVIRALQNPDRIRQMQDTTGPYASGVTFAAETLGDMTITPDDRAILAGTAVAKRRAFTINTYPACDSGVHGEVCSLRFGAAYCSCGSDINGGAGAIFEQGATGAILG